MEGHSVDVKGRAVVKTDDTFVEPAAEDPCGVLVPVEPGGLVRNRELDVDRVVGTPCRKLGPLGGPDHVIGGRDDVVGVYSSTVVTDRSEGLEPRHQTSCLRRTSTLAASAVGEVTALA